MIPARFDYYRAESVEQAVELLERHEGSMPIVGGHSLVPMLKLRLSTPPALVDLSRIPELRGVSRDGGTIRVGATTTHRDLANDPELRRGGGLLSLAAAAIGDPQVRSFGTIGGNLAHADPASDLPAATLALDAEVVLFGPNGERRMPAAEFLVDVLCTAAGPAEILTAIEFAALPEESGAAYLKTEHPASGYAVCAAAAVVRVDGAGRCVDARLAYNGVAPTAFRHDLSSLHGASADEREAAIDAACGSIAVADPLGDAYASGAYRLALARVQGGRALRRAFGDAG